MLKFLFGGQSPQEKFWNWFVKEEEYLFRGDAAESSFQRKVNHNLKAVNKGLTWEFGPPSKEPRQFVISADGIRDVFAAVEELADAAPLVRLPRWRIVRFRPRCHELDDFSIEMNGKEVATKDIEVSLQRQGVKVGLEVFIRGCRAKQEDAYVPVAFVLLDVALGEYDVECKVGSIEVNPFESAASGEPRIPFARLREAFDAMVEDTCGDERG